MKLGFGPLTGIKLERHLPDETEGGSGIIVKSAEREETAVLSPPRSAYYDAEGVAYEPTF